jgi:hypothetical protein
MVVDRGIVDEMFDVPRVARGGSAHHSVDFVSLLEQEIAKVAAVLSGDSED